MSDSSKTLEKALSIIEREVDKLDKLSISPDPSSPDSHQPLDRGAAATLNDYVKALITARKDEREQSKGEELHRKTDNELDELARQALEYLQGPKETRNATKLERRPAKRKRKPKPKPKKAKAPSLVPKPQP